MREQTWHNCQAADGLANARSQASPGPPRDPGFSSRYICSIDRDRNPPALHASPSAADQSREGLHREHRSFTRRYPLSIATDSIAQKLPPHAPPSTADLIGEWLAIELAARVPGRAKKSTAREGTATVRHTEKIASGSTLGKYQVNYAKPLEMTYFQTLHFILGVCKQQQMSNQLYKTLGDALKKALVRKSYQGFLPPQFPFKIAASRVEPCHHVH